MSSRFNFWDTDMRMSTTADDISYRDIGSLITIASVHNLDEPDNSAGSGRITGVLQALQYDLRKEALVVTIGGYRYQVDHDSFYVTHSEGL